MNDLPKQRTFTQWDPIFDNSYSKVGPEFGEVHESKIKFAEEKRGSYDLQVEVPQNIAGLINKLDCTRKAPTPARFFRHISSFERNGMFNIHTPAFNVRWTTFSFFILLSWGWTSFQTGAYNTYRQYDGYELGSINDKLTTRSIPATQMWNRPG